MNIGFEVESDILKTALKILSSTVAGDNATTGLDSIYMELNPASGYKDLLIRTSDGTDYTELIMTCLVTRNNNNITDFPRVSFKRFRTIISTMPDQTLLTITDDGGGISIKPSIGKGKPILLKNSNANKGALVTYASGIKNGSEVIIATDKLTYAMNYASKIYDKNDAFLMHNCAHLMTGANGRDLITTVSNTNIKTCHNIVEFLPGSAPNVNVLLNIDKMCKVLPNFIAYDNVEIDYDNKFISVVGDTIKNNPDSIMPGISAIPYFKHYHRFNVGIFPPLETMIYGKIPAAQDEIIVSASVLNTMLKRISAITDSNPITGFELIMYDDIINMKYESTYGDIDFSGKGLNQPLNQLVVAKISQTHLGKLMGLIDKDKNVCISSINVGSGDILMFHEEGDDDNYFTLSSMLSLGNKASLIQVIDAYKLAAQSADESTAADESMAQEENAATVQDSDPLSDMLDDYEDDEEEDEVP